MASLGPSGNVNSPGHLRYTSHDSGHHSEDRTDAEQVGSEDDFSNVQGSRVVHLIAVQSSNASLRLVSNFSSISTRPGSYNESNIHTTRYDHHIQNVRHILARADYLAPDQQRYLTKCLATLYSLRCVAPSTRLLTITENLPLPVYGPHPRPLSTAAIRQNEQARRSRERVAFYAKAGHVFPNSPVYKPAPMRYNDAYDDLVGYCSLENGTSAAYAERDDDEAVYAIRFSRTAHMGLGFGRGHLYMTTEDRRLVEGRQARWLAGLSTREVDREIAYRVLRDMDAWGWLGQCVGETEWTERARCYCETVYCASRTLERSLII
jgi:hypothetical protein